MRSVDEQAYDLTFSPCWRLGVDNGWLFFLTPFAILVVLSWITAPSSQLPVTPGHRSLSPVPQQVRCEVISHFLG